MLDETGLGDPVRIVRSGTTMPMRSAAPPRTFANARRRCFG